MAGPKIDLTRVTDKKAVAARRKDKKHEDDHKWANDLSASTDKSTHRDAVPIYRNITSKGRDKKKREAALFDALKKTKGK